MSKKKITGFIPFNKVTPDGDVLLPGCFDLSKSRNDGVKILETHNPSHGVRVIKSFEAFEASLMPDGSIELGMYNVEYENDDDNIWFKQPS